MIPNQSTQSTTSSSNSGGSGSGGSGGGSGRGSGGRIVSTAKNSSLMKCIKGDYMKFIYVKNIITWTVIFISSLMVLRVFVRNLIRDISNNEKLFIFGVVFVFVIVIVFLIFSVTRVIKYVRLIKEL